MGLGPPNVAAVKGSPKSTAHFSSRQWFGITLPEQYLLLAVNVMPPSLKPIAAARVAFILLLADGV